MRKIHILKAIVDFIWIISTPLIIVLIILIPGIFIFDMAEFGIKINHIPLNTGDIKYKILIAFLSVSYLLTIYSLFLFRKSLRFFLKVKVFDEFVITSFSKIGVLLCISGAINLIVAFISNSLVSDKLSVTLGINPHLIIICFGLFFMILSEVFTIAKKAKQENDLTI